MMASADALLEKGMADVKAKSLYQIQYETAFTWAGRACGAAKMGNMADAIEYGHEAIEHAALSGDDSVLGAVRKVMRNYGVPV